MSASTAKRRRRQAVNGYRHLAKIGKGNNNRPVYGKRSLSKLARKEAAYRAKQKQIAARRAFAK